MTATSADPVTDFFDRLQACDREPLLNRARGTLRFDVTDEPVHHWYIDIDHGKVDISHRADAADASVTVDHATLSAIVTGQINAMAAFLRGELVASGDLGMVILFQRLYAGPGGSS